MKSFSDVAGRRPCSGAGARRRAGDRAAGGAGAATAARRSRGLSCGDRGGQGNPGDEERQRDVRQRRARHRRADQAALLQSNLNYQKDLNEVALIVAKKLAGREKEIGEGMAKIYASEFTEQELKDLVTFYKSPLGKKLLASEPRAIQLSMAYMNPWAQNFAEAVNGQFRAEMRKRGKEI